MTEFSQLTKKQRRFIRDSAVISLVGLAAFFLGDTWSAAALFAVGLAVLMLGLTMLGQVIFQEYWIAEEQQKPSP